MTAAAQRAKARRVVTPHGPPVLPGHGPPGLPVDRRAWTTADLAPREAIVPNAPIVGPIVGPIAEAIAGAIASIAATIAAATIARAATTARRR